ncbi:acyltransferase domain-containing protein, partial [Microbispora bryophytorum]|uniref:acyltransferase domain-containing protein n=1 Tax=Microbispora bryophytorum TaxID=1460882 RepID=UPI0033E08A9C
MFAVEVALHALLAHWGVSPDVLVGHSIGEIAAARLFAREGARVLLAPRTSSATGSPRAAAVVSVRSSPPSCSAR